MDAVEFFNELFGDATGWLQLWRVDTKSTKWLKYPLATNHSVSKYVEASWKKPFNAYYGVCLQGEDSGAKSRGKTSKATVVPGVWADVDFVTKDQGDTKNKKKYPTREQNDQAVKLLGLAPTITVDSGGGLHLYWLLEKPFEITDEKSRDWIAGVVKAWQRKLRVIFIKMGVSLDSTHDLCRVLRLPRSTNTKVINQGGTHEVQVVGEVGQRYKIEQFEAITEYPVAFSAPKSSQSGAASPHKASSVTSGTCSTSKPLESKCGVPSFPPELAAPNAEPPSMKLSSFCEFDENFKRCWSNDVKKYQSSSEYHMALANYAIGAEWTPEETAALLVAFTREHYPRVIEKVLRINNGVQDYLHRTIGKAYDRRRVEQQAKLSEQSAEDLARTVRDSQEEGTKIDRQVVLDHLTSMLGVVVVGFRKTGAGRNFEYSITVLPKGKKKPVDCLIGNAAKIMNPAEMACALLDSISYVFVVTKKIRMEWKAILQGLMSIVEVCEIPEVSYANRAVAVIEELLRVSGCEEVKNDSLRNQLLIEKRPYLQDGKLFLPGSSLRQLITERDAQLGNSIFTELTKMKFCRRTIAAKGTSRSIWVLDDPTRFMGVINSGMSSVFHGGEPESNGEG